MRVPSNFFAVSEEMIGVSRLGTDNACVDKVVRAFRCFVYSKSVDGPVMMQSAQDVMPPLFSYRD